MKRLGEIKRSMPKVAAAWRRSGGSSGFSPIRNLMIKVQVQRGFDYGAKGYRAEACVVSKTADSRRYRPCGYGNNTTPTRAVKGALTALVRGLK